MIPQEYLEEEKKKDKLCTSKYQPTLVRIVKQFKICVLVALPQGSDFHFSLSLFTSLLERIFCYNFSSHQLLYPLVSQFCVSRTKASIAVMSRFAVNLFTMQRSATENQKIEEHIVSSRKLAHKERDWFMRGCSGWAITLKVSGQYNLMFICQL